MKNLDKIPDTIADKNPKNWHIKKIGKREYYYESIRVGKKTTSRYLGPVERLRTKKVEPEVNTNVQQDTDDTTQ